MQSNAALNDMPLAPDQSREEYHEPAMGEAQKVSLSSNPRMRLFAVLINFLVISELCVAMYFAQQTPDRLTPVFFKVFFSLLVPTLVAAVVGRRLIAKAER